MALQEMFPAVANSPATELSAAITDIQTTITLLDASKLPDAPNIATIGVDESAETVRYEGKSGNTLTGVTRGFNGTAAKAWAIGVGVARYFTAYDVDALRENVTGHSAELVMVNAQLVEAASGATTPFQVIAEDNAYNKIPNAVLPLNIPTYEGSGQTTHPSVLYFPEGWNGYKFWMCHTPYAFGDNQLENPSIVASNDNVTWTEPAPNPIGALITIGEGTFNSDGHIFMRGNTMELWYRAATSESNVHIFRRTTTDGVNWTARELLFTNQTFDLVRSPAIRYFDGKYRMWYDTNSGSDYKIIYAESIDGKNWTGRRQINIPLDSSYYFWHVDAIVTNGKYELTLHCYTKVGGNTAVFYSSSLDNVNYSRAIKIIEPTFGQGLHDSGQVYKASCVKVGDMWYVYYGSISQNNEYKVGLTTGYSPLTLGLRGSKTEVKTFTSPSNFYFASDKINRFPKNQITITKIFQGNGFPAQVGTLITDNSIPERGRQRQHFFVHGSNDFYTRSVRADSDDWGILH